MSLNDYEPPPLQQNEHPACWDLLFERHEFQELSERVKKLLEEDIRERDVKGTEKYGVRLKPFNGRNALHDFYQEQLDGLVYSVQYLHEMVSQFPAGGTETQNAYHLYQRTLDIVVDTRRLIFKNEGR